MQDPLSGYTTFLVDAANIARWRPLLETSGRTLYEDSFPVPDERQEFDTLMDAIAVPTESLTSVAVVTIPEGGDRIDAMLLREFYRKAGAVLCTYGMVRRECRKRGIMRSLVTGKGLEMIRSRFGSSLKAVFMEMENPDRVPPPSDPSVISPSARQAFFESCGFERIPVEYVQPPLGKDKDFCRDLLLYALGGASSDTVKGFIRAFYDEMEKYCPERLLATFRAEEQRMCVEAEDFGSGIHNFS